MIQWLADQCERHLLAEKWLIAADLRIAQQWQDRVCLAGTNTINLHSKTVPTVALSLISNLLAERELSFAGQSTARMLIGNVVRELLGRDSTATGRLQYFHDVQSVDGLCDLLARTIRDLRLANVAPTAIVEASFEMPTKAADVREIYTAYLHLLKQHSLVDYAGSIELATRGVTDGSIELPVELLILMPEQPQVAVLEQRLLTALSERVTLEHPKDLDTTLIAAERLPERIAAHTRPPKFFAGLGEVNEIRGVFQHILSAGQEPRSAGQEIDVPLDDVELLYTDTHQYVPVVLEQLTSWLADNAESESKVIDLDSLPVTFAEGIACIYSRPGRALRGWLRWARHDFVQTRAVQLIREGLLNRPEGTETIGYARLANTLREVPIGFQADRYLAKITEAIEAAQQRLKEYRERGDAESDEGLSHRDFGLSSLGAVMAMMKPLIDLAPLVTDSTSAILTKARSFLLASARAENKLDRYARAKLVDDIDGMLMTIHLASNELFDPATDSGTDLDVRQWLEDLAINSSILANGPQPGCIHVAPLSRGGHTGRKRLFVVGLDDGRYPRRVPVDPLLLDSERTRLSTDLPTSQERSEEVGQWLERAIFRSLTGPECEICLSYSSRSLNDDRANFPSPSMLELFRLTTQSEAAHMDDLLAHLGSPVAFVSANPDDHLSPSDQDLAELLIQPDPVVRQQSLEARFPQQRQQRIASEARSEPVLNEYDGLVPTAGVDLDPCNVERVSPSRLETFGACPRRFFFRYGLGVYPPDEHVVDQQRWLDPLQLGNLVHDLFEQFLGELTTRNAVPNFDRDRLPLHAVLQTKVERLRSDIPIPNEDTYRQTVDTLQEMCDIFLAKEEEYCRQRHARPWVMEASFGLGGEATVDETSGELDCREPIPLTLSDGRVIRAGGRIDRVDKLMSGGSERYAIWDYKSGSSYGFDQQKPFNQGRKLQPFLYVGMLRHRIAATGGDPDAVESFGYFFPSPRTEGLRLSWTGAELRGGDDVLRNISDLIARGVFLPTTEKGDCRYCDYLSVCGDPEIVTANSTWKSSEACNGEILKPWKELREL